MLKAKIIRRKRRIYRRKKGQYVQKQGKKVVANEKTKEQLMKIKKPRRQPRSGNRDFNEIQNKAFIDKLRAQFLQNYQIEQFKAQVNEKLMKNEKIIDVIEKKIQKHQNNPERQQTYKALRERAETQQNKLRTIIEKPYFEDIEAQKKQIQDDSLSKAISSSVVSKMQRIKTIQEESKQEEIDDSISQRQTQTQSEQATTTAQQIKNESRIKNLKILSLQKLAEIGRQRFQKGDLATFYVDKKNKRKAMPKEEKQKSVDYQISQLARNINKASAQTVHTRFVKAKHLIDTLNQKDRQEFLEKIESQEVKNIIKQIDREKYQKDRLRQEHEMEGKEYEEEEEILEKPKPKPNPKAKGQGLNAIFEFNENEGIFLEDMIDVIKNQILPFAQNTEFHVIQDYDEIVDYNYNKDQIILFLINEHYTVLYLKHGDLTVNYFDSLASPERRRQDVMFLQPHLFLFNEEYKFRVKYNTVNFQQKDPSLKYACGWFIYEFLHRMIILKESFNKATDFINPKIESFFTNM